MKIGLGIGLVTKTLGGGAIPPVNTVAPVISGTAVVGQVLSTTNGTWDNIPLSFSYQWKRGVTNVGTNANTYTLVSADAGQSITCVVTATNAGGSANATSNALSILATVLDMFGNSAIGLSASRLLKGAYYGSPILRIRRSGDNLESDFGVNTLGVLDNSAVQTWINAGGGTQIGFVVTLYDQTNNSRHFIQSNPLRQPKIRFNFSVNNRAALLLDTNNMWLEITSSVFTYTGSGDVYVSNSTSMSNAGQYGAILTQQTSPSAIVRQQLLIAPQFFNNANIRPAIDSYGGIIAAQSTVSNTALNEVVVFRYKWENYSTAHNNGNTVISKNNVAYTLSNPSSASGLGSAVMRIGRVLDADISSSNPQFLGSICDIIIYTNVNSNTSDLNSNMRNFVGI
jgi:hypothetical protein